MKEVVITQSKPTIGTEELSAIGDVLKGGHLAMGAVVSRFEQEFKNFIGTEYSCGVNSGTSALHLALLSLGVKAGDEVMVPSYTCTALLNAVRYTGATPVPADIDPLTLSISADEAALKVNKHTRAIIAVHNFGLAAEIEALTSLGVSVIEDCAHSVGGYAKGKKMGTLGKAAVFSFYPTKMMATGEGGMLATSSKAIDIFARNSRSYDQYDGPLLAYNYKMTDISAAMGLVQLSKLASFIGRRRAIAERYDNFFKKIKKVSVPDRDYAADVFYRYLILFTGKDRADVFMEAMQRVGIVCDRPVFKPLHRILGLKDSAFPVTSDIYDRGVSIPIYPSLADSDVASILGACEKYFSGGPR